MAEDAVGVDEGGVVAANGAAANGADDDVRELFGGGALGRGAPVGDVVAVRGFDGGEATMFAAEGADAHPGAVEDLGGGPRRVGADAGADALVGDAGQFGVKVVMVGEGVTVADHPPVCVRAAAESDEPG